MLHTFLYSLVLSLVFVTLVHAQQGTPVRGGENISREVQQKAKILPLQEVRKEAKEKIQSMQNEIQEKQKVFRGMVKEKRLLLKKEIEKERVKLKTQLKSIRDIKKKETVERIGITLNEINERQVTHATAVVEKVETVLVRIRERMTVAEGKGVDVSEVKTAFVIAEGAITAAKTAIEAQSKKMYTVTVSTEAKLRDDVGGARTLLHTDVSKVRDVIRAAHSAVQNVATALAKIPRTMQIIESPISGIVEPARINTSQ